MRLAIGGQNQMVYLPTTLGAGAGLLREEGLDVELQDFQGGAKALQALVGGSADVVSGFYDHTIQMAAEGRELVAFVNMLRYPGLVLATSPQAAATVTTIEDLKGKIVGVTTAGSSSQMFLTFLLARHHVPVDTRQRDRHRQRSDGDRRGRARQGGRRLAGRSVVHDGEAAESDGSCPRGSSR